ncbi:hypothetical protein C2S52_012320 [Perilla frutescens var. hirtella]|nr:hypothetical protein C2S52_012320 [Perilla frutescens var. hirtella]
MDVVCTAAARQPLQLAYALDSCFGLAISPGNLALAVARRYDADLLDPMYEGRNHKASVEFLWVGGQQLDLSSITSSEMKDETFPGFPREELIWWEMNILWSLNQYENPNRLLNILDIVAALLAFKQSAPKYVEHILLKWLASCLGSKSENFPTLLSEAFKFLPKLSSRQLHLINLVSRRVVLKGFITENARGKKLVLEGLSDDKKEHINFLPSNSSDVFSKVGDWSPDGLPQMEQWVLQNEKNVKKHSKFLAAEIRKVEKRKLQESVKYEVHEYCNYCLAVVPFESTEHAVCSGVKNNDGITQTHKLERCTVTMRILLTKASWYCMSCQRRATKLAPSILFAMPEVFCATAAATRSVIQSSSLPLTPISYFAATITSVSNSENIDANALGALTSFISIVLPLVGKGELKPEKAQRLSGFW